MNNIIIDSDISCWGYSARWLRSKLDGMTGKLEVELSSYGGDVFEGIAMFNILRQYSKNNGEVTVVVNSHAMSIASLIFLAGDVKKAHENSTIMIHKAWTWLAGNSDDLLAEAKVLEGIDSVLAYQYGKYMDQSKDDIMQIMSDEGWYIGKEQMQTTGFIDEFISSDDEVEVSARSNFKSAMARFSAKAQEEDVKPNFDEVKVAILECNDGKCPAATMPSDNEKLVNSNKGASMTQEQIDAMEMQNKVFGARITTLEAREKNLESDLSNATNALDDAKASMDSTIEAKLSEAAEVYKAETETRVREAIGCSVDADTAVAMLNADTTQAASDLAIAAKQSDGGTPQDGWNEKAQKDNDAMAVAMAYANKTSVGGRK